MTPLWPGRRPAPNQVWRRQAREALFGTNWLGPVAVLTPIAPIYSSLSGDGKAVNGWWPSAVRNDALIVKIPQSSAAMDALFALRPESLVTFIGLAGALSGQAPGAVVDPSAAFLATPRILDGRAAPTATISIDHRTYPTKPTVEGVTAATVRCLAESTLLHRKLSPIADCVDMESAYIFSASAAAGHQARCLLVISDPNQNGAVFHSDIAQLRPSLDQVCESVLSELAEGIR